MDRACTRFGSIMLNGRCILDGLGLPTCHQGNVWSTVDYALVPHVARGDWEVLDVPGGALDHQALFVMLPAHCPVVAAAAAV